MKYIDKKSRLPLYHQLVDIIIGGIEEDQIAEHEKLLSEREYCEKYDISRATVRQAIQELEKSGYIYKRHGKGTFVSPKAFKQDLLKFYSFTEEMKKLGKVPASQVLEFEIVQCDRKVARKLDCKEGDWVYELIRLRLADDEPMMYEKTYLPVSRFPKLTKVEIQENSMYDVFVQKYSVKFSRAEEKLRPVMTRKSEAQLLDIDDNVPSMLIERITYENEEIIEYTRGIARGDRFEYRVILEK